MLRLTFTAVFAQLKSDRAVVKVCKGECLSSVYYEHFEGFKQAISQCLAQTTGKYKDTLASWLSLKFQTLKNAS